MRVIILIGVLILLVLPFSSALSQKQSLNPPKAASQAVFSTALQKEISPSKTTLAKNKFSCLAAMEAFSSALRKIFETFMLAASLSTASCPESGCDFGKEFKQAVPKAYSLVPSLKSCPARTQVCRQMAVQSESLAVQENLLFYLLVEKAGISADDLKKVISQSPLYQFGSLVSPLLAYAEKELC